jgi:energy-converting hydrogenase A subunit M
VDLGGVDEALQVLVEAKDCRSLLGLVAADALEDRGAVVHDVGEDVDLGVLVGDEVSVVPDLRLHGAAAQGQEEKTDRLAKRRPP